MHGWNYWRQYLDAPISGNDNHFSFFNNVILISFASMSVWEYAAMFNECVHSPSKLVLFMRDLKQGNDNMIHPIFSKSSNILKHVDDKGVIYFFSSDV